MTETGGIPTVREELNRKTFETIEWLFDRLRAGLLSQQQFSTGVDAVWSTANGLVDDSILEIVSEANAAAGKEPARTRRVFTKDGAVIVTRWIVGEEQITYEAITPGRRVLKTVETSTALEACQALEKLATKLLTGGWEEL